MEDDAFGPREVREDDVAAMLAALEQRLDRYTIARALGTDRSKLDLIAIGHVPAPEVTQRLHLLYQLSRNTEGDLTDPRTLLEGLGVPAARGRFLVPAALVPSLRRYLIAFVVIDALAFAALVVLLLLRA